MKYTTLRLISRLRRKESSKFVQLRDLEETCPKEKCLSKKATILLISAHLNGLKISRNFIKLKWPLLSLEILIGRDRASLCHLIASLLFHKKVLWKEKIWSWNGKLRNLNMISVSLEGSCLKNKKFSPNFLQPEKLKGEG